MCLYTYKKRGYKKEFKDVKAIKHQWANLVKKQTEFLRLRRVQKCNELAKQQMRHKSRVC